MLYMPVTHWSGVINVQNAILQHADLYTEYRNRARELRDLLFSKDQIGLLVDEHMAFVSPPGKAITAARMDEAMWNYHPRTAASHRGAFYRNPASQKFNGGTITRTLTTADHAGMAAWIKDFTVAGYGAQQLDAEAADAAIPNRPTISYAGAPGYPADDIVLRAGPFGDPQGAGTFGAMRWRVAEVTPPGAPWDPTARRRYEIEPVWESAVLTTYSDTARVPVEALRVGGLHRARVRVRDNTGRWSRWSEPLELTVGPPRAPLAQQKGLRVSEVHYHPPGDLREEFVELVNVGAAAMDLRAVALTEGIRFRFDGAAVQSLGPGERVVIVESLHDFRARYGTTGIRVAGEYDDRLANSGERLVLTVGREVIVQDFTFDDAWYPLSDGNGRSLEVIDPKSPAEQGQWSARGNWRASAEVGGTPGR